MVESEEFEPPNPNLQIQVLEDRLGQFAISPRINQLLDNAVAIDPNDQTLDIQNLAANNQLQYLGTYTNSSNHTHVHLQTGQLITHNDHPHFNTLGNLSNSIMPHGGHIDLLIFHNTIDHHNKQSEHDHHNITDYRVLSVHFENVEVPLTLMVFILLVLLVKVLLQNLKSSKAAKVKDWGLFVA